MDRKELDESVYTRKDLLGTEICLFSASLLRVFIYLLFNCSCTSTTPSTKKALSNHVEHKHLRTLSSFSHKSWWEKTMAFTYYTYNMSDAVVFHLHTYPRHVVLKCGERLIVSFIPSSWCWHHSSKLSAVVNCSLFSEKDQWTWNWLLRSTEMKFFSFPLRLSLPLFNTFPFFIKDKRKWPSIERLLVNSLAEPMSFYVPLGDPIRPANTFIYVEYTII